MATLCIPIPELDGPKRLTLPGGIAIEHLNLMEVIQPALTPLVPIFDIIDTVVAVFQCLKAVPEMIGPPPDPTALLSCLADLAKKVAKLLGLIPQVSLPMTVVGIVDLVIDALRGFVRHLRHLHDQVKRIARVIDRAAELNDPGLLAIGNCAQEHVDQEAANVGQALASLGGVIGLLNVFLGLIGQPEIPGLSGVLGQPLDPVIANLETFIETLQRVRSAIPLP